MGGSGVGMGLKTRPDSCDDKKGVAGTPINLVTNFFKMSQWVSEWWRGWKGGGNEVKDQIILV